jgi:ElaB/YqjD/DUF883 family membrane-anchored ribosome-binding protein
MNISLLIVAFTFASVFARPQNGIGNVEPLDQDQGFNYDIGTVIQKLEQKLKESAKDAKDFANDVKEKVNVAFSDANQKLATVGGENPRCKRFCQRCEG